MKQLAFWVFVAGVVISACYGAKLAPVEEGAGSGPDGVVTPADRISSWWDAAAMPFSVGVLMMVGGGLLGRHIEKLAHASAHEGQVSASGDGPGEVMDKIGQELDKLPAGSLGDSVAEVQAGLDRVLEELVPEFLLHRTRMIADMGLEHFAEMIGQFSSFERNTARAWSALTDGVPSEAEVSVERAKAALVQAKEAFDRAADASGSASA
ncbi:MAG: hypothetical protein JRH11_01080 [Deltaproteobacteria bacterium]|nr:hypothetical protein [Deltaproteobacteria bacterium]